MGQLSQSQDLGAGLKSRHVTMLLYRRGDRREFICRLQRRHCRGRPGGAAGLSVCRAAGGDDYAYAGRNGGAATPDTGSFSTYADKAIGRWAGYTIGWLYWWFWVLVIPLEANIAAIILHSWVPGVPVWLFSLLITLALTGSNLLSVKNYGEFEFWLALCKVDRYSGVYRTGRGRHYRLLSLCRSERHFAGCGITAALCLTASARC